MSLARVAAMGVSSSLGPLVQAAAAFRAGMSRTSAAPDFETMAPGDEEPGPLLIHALRGATFGFSGVGRLVALLAGAFADLAAATDLSKLGPETPLHLALPDPEARNFITGKDADQEDPEEEERRLELLANRVVPPALAAAGIRWWGGPRREHGGDQVAVALALAAAAEQLRSGRARSAVVAAVDSLCSEPTLRLLHSEDRLKTPTAPTGLMPGEAAVVVVLEPERSSSAAKEDRPVVLRAIELETDEPFEEDAPPTLGKPLAACARAALGPLPGGAPAPLLISDHDGQQHRAHEWGMLLMHLAEADRRLAGCPSWMPATSFGHTGAASGALALALALRGFQRGYAPAPSALILSSADEGGRAAIHVGID